MIVEVNDVIKPEAMDTVVRFVGTNTADEKVTFGVDHRPAKELVGAMRQLLLEDGMPLLAEIEDWQILSVECVHVAIADQDRMVCTKCGKELKL